MAYYLFFLLFSETATLEGLHVSLYLYYPVHRDAHYMYTSIVSFIVTSCHIYVINKYTNVYEYVYYSKYFMLYYMQSIVLS